MNKPIVTIFVTVYNIEEYLDRFFACLAEQTITEYEVLLIDDGSSDNSLAVCRKYAQTDNRIRILTSEHIGISAVRNILLSQITTPFATSLDGDDFFDKDYLKHLLDAQKKYDADYVISNIIFLTEKNKEIKRFIPREEGFFTEDDFPQIIPALLEEDRLNYLYGKLYRGALLKDVRVEPDVRQGSDTIINCQYLLKINNLAVIEDYDYCNIRYTSRSVTSYNKDDYFFRLYKINRYVYDLMEQNGRLDETMLRAIDGRILFSGLLSVNRIALKKEPFQDRCAAATNVIQSEEFRTSYERQKQRGNLDTYPFTVIGPGKEEAYLKLRCEVLEMERKDKRHEEIRKWTPDFLVDLYHKAKAHR
ncbi:MAG: glycosyltransferase family 2 protein [Ruminococcus sp.]|nr:glycosyltransferase family 2 protein [Ruminococcus sp.]